MNKTNKIVVILSFCLGFILNYAEVNAQCNNVDFENCDFTGWTGTTSKNANASTPSNPDPYRYRGMQVGATNQDPSAKPEKSQFIVSKSVNNGYDPYLGGTVLKAVDPLKPGNCSARLGNAQADGGGETLQYSWVVSSTNNSFTYDYASVMLDPGQAHNLVQAPYFKITMWYYNSPTDSVEIPCAHYFVTTANAPGYKSATVGGTVIGGNVIGGTAVLYKDWSSVTIPLDNYIGKQVKIIFETRDCCPTCPTLSTGSHWSYAYIDCSCSPLDIIPSPPAACKIPTKLIAPAGAASYSWLGPHIVSGAQTQTVTINGPGTYSVNMTTFGQTTCTYTRTVTVSALPRDLANFSANTPCVGSATLFNDASTIIASTTYSWDFGDGSPTSSTINPSHTYANAGTYPVKLTLNSTCPGDTTINVKVLPYPTSPFTTETVCVNVASNIIYTGTAPVGSTFSWNFDGGTVLSGVNQGPYKVSWPNSGTKKITLTVNSAGCISSNTVTAVVNPYPVITASSTSICAGNPATINASGANGYVWNTGVTTSSLTDSPANTTTYTVIGTTLGCSDTTTGTIQIVFAPLVIVTPDTICPGATAMLTASGASGYSWSTGQTINPISVNPLITSTYTVSGIGCPNTATGTVIVNPIPIVSTASATICAGSYTTLTASGADSYVWSTGATDATITESPMNTTSYTVTGNSLGCVSTATCTITANVAPILTASSATICVGQSATLNVSGADSYTWTPLGVVGSSITQSPINTTTYIIKGLKAGITCLGTTTTTITVNPLPIVSVTSTTICNNQGPAGTITASGADTYLWNTGETTASITHSPSSTTTYNVTGKTIYGCIGTASGTIVVNPIPVVTVTSSTICEGATAILTASGADTYVWDDGTSGSTLTTAPENTNHYTVTGTTLGCSSTGTGTITVNPLPTPVSTSATICKGQSATLTASGANSFIWSEGTIGANMTASPASTTTYTVTGNSLGCTLTAVGTIKVNPIPVITVVPSTVCAGTVGSLQASGANSYVWNTGATSAAIAATPLTTTGYTVTGTSLGCSSTRTGTITVNPIPTLSVTNTTICRGQAGTITASTATPGTASYSWATGASTASLTLSPTYTSVYNVTVSIKGCTKSASGTITVLIAPVVTISHPTICDKQSATVTAYGAKAYTWSTGETTNPIIVSPHVTTTYSVVGLGCPNGTSGTVIVNPNPVISATSATVCQGISATIQVKGADSYMWVTGDTTRQITDVPPTSGIHYYSVVGSTFAGCNDTTKGTITVNPNPKIKVNNDTICPGDFGKLTASGANSYFWTTGSRSNTIQMSPPLTTTYTVTGTTNAGCVGDGTGTIYVSKFPTADFVISPNPTTVFNTEIAFTNKSSVDVVYWHWDFGDGKTLYPNTASPLHTYAAEVGTYTITLIVHNITPCWDTIDYQLYVGPEYAFYIPNCFTPNGDIHNEGFRGRGIGIEQYKLQIFDRWGLNIWQSTNLDESWDGKIKGYDNLVQQDVYVWKVFILDVFGKEHSYVGTVTVLR